MVVAQTRILVTWNVVGERSRTCPILSIPIGRPFQEIGACFARKAEVPQCIENDRLRVNVISLNDSQSFLWPCLPRPLDFSNNIVVIRPFHAEMFKNLFIIIWLRNLNSQAVRIRKILPVQTG